MPLPRYERVAQDLAGNALGGASVEVFYAGSTSKPTLYSDEDGNNTKSNPFTADSTGYFFFYVADGVYDVKVTYGATSVTYQNQQIFHPANRVSKAGDTMTGALVIGTDPGGSELLRAASARLNAPVLLGSVPQFTMSSDPSSDLQVATKQYVDSRASSPSTVSVFDTPGTYTWNKPSGCKKVWIRCWGGGGGGGGNLTGSAGGGGGGGYAERWLDVTGISSATVVVGAGGSGGTGTSSGGSGGTSEFSVGGTTYAEATGGGGGGTGTGSPGTGGSGTVGDVLMSGGPGIHGTRVGGGSPGGGPSGGAFPGAGGNGGSSSNGSPGAGGLVIIVEYY
jgi:hypothetical protein